ncbi:MAG: helix-turn-helix transcriptional regulator [Maritimibacter sp.]|nr:helix-turn-helix transcriptional regulator [Maritimibacter sp.]
MATRPRDVFPETAPTDRRAVDRPGPNREIGPRLAPHAPELSSLMRVLGHTGRLLLLGHLSDGGKTVRQLQALLDAPQPLVSSHLARLRLEGLVRFDRVGKTSVYRLEDGPVADLLGHLDRVVCAGLGPHVAPRTTPGPHRDRPE